MSGRAHGNSLALFVLTVIALAPAGLAQTSKPAGSQLILLDGAAVPFESLDIQAGRLRGDGVPADLTLDDLRRIELPAAAAPSQEKPAAIVDLRGGGRLLAKSVALSNELCRVEWGGGEPLSLPVDLLRAIRLDPNVANVEFEKAIATPSAELDRIFIRDEAGKLSSVTGLVDSLDLEQSKIEVSGEVRQVPRSRVFGIVCAQPAASETPPHCQVAFLDGSVLGGETLSLKDKMATISFGSGGHAEFSWSKAARVAIRSSRVAFLSDLKPIAEEQQPIVTLPLAARHDKSVSGQPLTLGTRIYEKGLGVHARSSLTFAADKKWDQLVATIGLDAAANGNGDCVFVVLADGQPLLTQRIKGTDPPAEIQLPITGRQQVTLLVEPGEGLDLADHANWCDVRFIKNK